MSSLEPWHFIIGAMNANENAMTPPKPLVQVSCHSDKGLES